jgi:Ca2+-transporting ATPase
VAALLAKTKGRQTPLQKSMFKLVRAIATVAAIAALGVFAVEIRSGHGWAAAVIAAISLLIAALPEEFSIVYSIYLALGAWRLAQEKALVRNLPGVETLGSVTVICTDKTGTLTEGALEVHETFALNAMPDLIKNAVLACEPQPFDPLDKAIVAFAMTQQLDIESLHGRSLIGDWAFDPHTKHVTHAWQSEDGVGVAAKGSLEGLLGICQPSIEDLTHLEEAHERMASQGMRVVAVAAGRLSSPPTERGVAENALSILGLVGFRDPIKPNVAEALQACRDAGIRVILITGDHPTTADAVAAELGLVHNDGTAARVALGIDMDQLSDGALDALVRDTDVFARTRPDQKHELITSLLRMGEVVAMTGDGVNDAPALRQADIGVVMGIRGTDVAREAATIVLLDDNFATIVKATSNGRRIYDNLSKAFRYLIAVHVQLISVALIAPLAGLPLVLLPIHLILFEILLHPIVSLVFQAEPAAPNIMQRPPRTSNFALSARALALPALVGATVSANVLGVFAWAISRDWNVDEARGAALFTLLMAQMVLMVSTRSSHLPMWRVWIRPTRELWFGWVAIVVTIVAIFAVPQLSELLSVSVFDARTLVPMLALVLVSTLWTEIAKAIKNR